MLLTLQWDYSCNVTLAIKKPKDTAEELVEPWSIRRSAILSKYTTSEKLSIVTSFLPGGEKGTYSFGDINIQYNFVEEQSYLIHLIKECHFSIYICIYILKRDMALYSCSKSSAKRSNGRQSENTARAIG